MKFTPFALASLAFITVVGCSQKPSEAELSRRRVACNSRTVTTSMKALIPADIEARLKKPNDPEMWNFGAELIGEQIEAGDAYMKDALRTHGVVVREYKTFKDLKGKDLEDAVFDYAMKVCIDG